MLINWAYKKYKAKKAAKEEKRVASEAAANPAPDPTAGQDVQATATTALQIEQPKE